MDVKYLNPFIEAFTTIMPQVGFETVEVGDIAENNGKSIVADGIIVVLGIVGDICGNIVYTIDDTAAKGISSVMMMGMPIDTLDEMAKSALSEMTNMLTATAATGFSALGIAADISTPTMIEGENISIKMTTQKFFSVSLLANGIPLKINVSLENK